MTCKKRTAAYKSPKESAEATVVLPIIYIEPMENVNQIDNN